LDRLARDFVVPAPLLARMQRIARAVERADGELAIAELGEELTSRGRACEHRIELEVRRARPVAAAELQHVHAQPRCDVEHLLEARHRQAVGDHSDVHDAFPPPAVISSASLTNASTISGVMSQLHMSRMPVAPTNS